MSSNDHTIQILTDGELLDISLSVLSKSITPTLSSRLTMTLYLRWLEIHRLNQTSRTWHWENTLLHWSQSLRSHGFLEIEIRNEVLKWKGANPDRLKAPVGRDWPTRSDIAKGFDTHRRTDMAPDRQMRRMREEHPTMIRDEGERNWESRELLMSRSRDREGTGMGNYLDSHLHNLMNNGDDFEPWSRYDAVPHKGYICNRCGQGGHHLQVCPTNLDPAWDDPPEPNYQCPICRLYGDHFKSLCPRNTNPYSINQRRNKRKIVTQGKVARKLLADEEREIQHDQKERLVGGLRRGGKDDDRLIYSRERSSSSVENIAFTQPYARRDKVFPMDASKRDTTQEEPISMDIAAPKSTPTSPARYRKRARSDDCQSGSERLSMQSSPHFLEESGKRLRINDQFSPEPEATTFTHLPKFREGLFRNQMASGSQQNYDINEDISDSSVDGQTAPPPPQTPDRQSSQFSQFYSSKMASASAEAELADYDDTSSINGDSNAPPPVKTYNSFVRALIKKRPQMSEIVNEYRRPTALDMWNRDDQRRSELYDNSGLGEHSENKSMKQSEVSSPTESRYDHEAFSVNAAWDEHPVASLRDSIAQEIDALLVPRVFADNQNEELYPTGCLSFENSDPEFLSSDTSFGVNDPLSPEAGMTEQNLEAAHMNAKGRSFGDMHVAPKTRLLAQVEADGFQKYTENRPPSMLHTPTTKRYDKNEHFGGV